MISVIIPTLNEAATLPVALRSVQANRAPHEVLVVDGNSADDTVAIARLHGAKALACPRAFRPEQMNRGAAAARGETLLFLHADTWLNPDSLVRIEQACRGGVIGGAFARRFRSPSVFLQATCRLADWRGRIWGLFLGDQGIFVKRSTFEALGGFPLIYPFEDVEFSLRMNRAGRTVLLDGPVWSSARRFRDGPLRRTWADMKLSWYFARERDGRLRSKSTQSRPMFHF